MSVGILLITHSGIGGAFLNVAYGTFGKLPLEISQLSVCRDPDPDLLIAKAGYLVRKLDAGDGVLVLTDMFGSTPSNVSQGLQHQGFAIRVVTGLNLPMLFRILNYPHLPLNLLAKKAVSGGKEGIFEPLTGRDIETAENLQTGKKKHATILRQKRVVVVD
ncbi:MAG: PTS fructose transporter subunit IIA [Gammaproteobacteria bacterium]|jgi:PTS system ascorbate-specific IIA component|nr:PTS fructose transporter subunit IIA [Gammaproteobacteria bacterium]